MTIKSPELLHTLMYGAIKLALALPFVEKPFYADLVLITDCGNVRIVGEARDMSDGGEAFYLNLAAFERSRYWVDKETGEPAWPTTKDSQWNAIDLTKEWKETASSKLLNEGRVVRFYRDVVDRARGLEPCGILQSAAAVSLRPSYSNEGELVIYATSRYPCSIEIAIDDDRCQEILLDLEEFWPFQ